MTDSTENTANSFKNPFMHFYFWIKSEMMDLEAMQQAINERNRIVELRQKLINKQRSDEQELSNLVAGKKTLKNMFKSKNSKEERCQHLKALITSATSDIMDYQKIISVINQHISEKSIPWFKQEKMANYFSMLDLLCSQELGNANISTSYWTMIQGQLAYSQH